MLSVFADQIYSSKIDFREPARLFYDKTGCPEDKMVYVVLLMPQVVDNTARVVHNLRRVVFRIPQVVDNTARVVHNLRRVVLRIPQVVDNTDRVVDKLRRIFYRLKTVPNPLCCKH